MANAQGDFGQRRREGQNSLPQNPVRTAQYDIQGSACPGALFSEELRQGSDQCPTDPPWTSMPQGEGQCSGHWSLSHQKLPGSCKGEAHGKGQETRAKPKKVAGGTGRLHSAKVGRQHLPIQVEATPTPTL